MSLDNWVQACSKGFKKKATGTNNDETPSVNENYDDKMQWIEKFWNRNKRMKEANNTNSNYPKAEAFEVGGFGGGFGSTMGGGSTNFNPAYDDSPIKSNTPSYSPSKAKVKKTKARQRTGTQKHSKKESKNEDSFAMKKANSVLENWWWKTEKPTQKTFLKRNKNRYDPMK